MPETLADRVHKYGAPSEVVLRALTDDRARWLGLHPGEVVPEVVETARDRVVWSSFWPVSPSDTIELDLSRHGSGTDVRMRWLSDDPPDERGVAITRQRLNTKLGGDLRGWLAADEAWRS